MAEKTKEILKVLTANRLKDGLVVFLGEGNAWIPWLQEAVIARTKDDAARLEARGAEHAKTNVVVGPYLMDVIEEAGQLRAAHIREHLRTLGPSVRTDLGKQAAGKEEGPAFI
jgi:hypothetical protein